MKKKYLIPVLLGLLVCTSSAHALIYNGNEYQVVFYEGQSWASATTHMQSTLGGDYHLATITSAAEQTFIQDTLLAGLGGQYWLGGLQIPSDTSTANANWSWVTGETWSYTNWAGGEPNDNYGPGSEQYLTMWSNFGWAWNDEGNLANITGYIAESPIPEPTTMLLFGTGISALAWVSRRRKKE